MVKLGQVGAKCQCAACQAASAQSAPRLVNAEKDQKL